MKLFTEGVPFLRANLHCHTSMSDGRATPAEAMRLYRDKGYDVLAITDHRKLTEIDPADIPDGLLALPGIELDYMLPGQAVHIVGLGLDDWNTAEWTREPGPQHGVDLIRSHGGEAVLAHPAWSMNTPSFMASLQNVVATEVWNSVSTQPTNPDRADSSSLIDVMAASTGRVLPLVASDDTHGYGAEVAAGWTMLQTSHRTPEGIKEALRAGRLYATQGPAFHQIEIVDGEIRVSCSEVDCVMFFSNMPWASGRCITGQNLTQAAYQLHAGETFIRVTLIDRDQNRAWSPMFSL